MKQLSLVALLILFSAPAMAYVGPGLGMGVIGTIFGVIAAIILALFGLFWYPLKRAFSKKKAGAGNTQVAPTIAENQQTAEPETLSVSTENLAKPHSSSHASNHSDASRATPDPVTSNHTDNQVQ